MNDDKRKVNLVPIDPGTHDWLVNQANITGKSIADHAGYLLDDAATQWEPPTEDEPERMVLWDYHRELRKKRMRDMVYRTAELYNDNPTDTAADLLAKQCERAEMDYMEVISKVKDDPYSSLIIFSHNGTKLGECIRWLSGTLRGIDSDFPVSLLEKTAAKRGYNMAMLNRAKRAMNQDSTSPRVMSVRKSFGWSWRMEEVEEQRT
jgi:hypothetical protein